MSRILVVVPDNGSRDHWYPMGAAHVALLLSRAGHEVTMWHQDLDHRPCSALLHHIVATMADLVMIGSIAGKFTYHRCLELCSVARRVDRPIRLILGGHGPSGAPEEYLSLCSADSVFVGSFGASDLEHLYDDGIIRCESGSSEDQLFWPTVDPTEVFGRIFSIVGSRMISEVSLPLVGYGRVPAPGAQSSDLVAPILSGMGCPHHCSFCFRLEDGRRERDVSEIIAEVRILRDEGFTYLQFQDELLTTSSARIRAICEAMGPLGLRWSCQGRSGVLARNQELPGVMREAGCRFVNFGVESTSDDVLRLMRKQQTIQQSTTAVEACQRAGIGTGLNMLWGLPGDTQETLDDNVNWLLTYDDHSQLRTIRPATPYPGSPLYTLALERGLASGVADFYTKLTNSDLVCFDFMGMGLAEANQALMVANEGLLSAWRNDLAYRQREQAKRLYVDRDASFRGWRQT